MLAVTRTLRVLVAFGFREPEPITDQCSGERRHGYPDRLALHGGRELVPDRFWKSLAPLATLQSLRHAEKRAFLGGRGRTAAANNEREPWLGIARNDGAEPWRDRRLLGIDVRLPIWMRLQIGR